VKRNLRFDETGGLQNPFRKGKLCLFFMFWAVTESVICGIWAFAKPVQELLWASRKNVAEFYT